MKIRNGFVSNSSSSSFIIRNTSNKVKTLVDFVKENPELLIDYLREFLFYGKEKRYTQESMIKDAKARGTTFQPKEQKSCVFGDEEGDVIGAVYDYQLRDSGKSKSFEWEFEEALR